MGLLELLSAKVENKMLEAKLSKNKLEGLKALNDMITAAQEKAQQQQGWADKGAMQLAPGSEDPNVINPQIEPVKPPGSILGNQGILNQILKVTAAQNPSALAPLAIKEQDPMEQFKKQIMAGMGGGGTGIDSLISDMAGMDPTKAARAASQGTALEMAGVPIFKATERVQVGMMGTMDEKKYNLAEKKYNDSIAAGIPESYTDPTGAEYTRYVNKVTKTPITGPNTDPAGWRSSKSSQLQPVDVVVPGKGNMRIWVTPKALGQEGGAVATGPEAQRVITEELPGGGQRQKSIPMSQPFDIETKQPSGKVAISGDELSLWVHPQTLATATQGMTPEQAKAEGFQRISTQAKQNIDALKAATVVVSEIKTLMAKVFPEKESFASPQRLLRPIGAAIQTDPDASRLFSLVNGTLAPVVRSLGEKGNLSDRDMERAKKLFLSGTDSAAVAWKKIDGVLELLGKIQRSTFSGAFKEEKTKVEPRKPGESAADYLKRTGG